MDSDIVLEIGPGQHGYTVRVIRAPAGGDTSGSFQLDIEAVLARLDELETAILASAVAARRTIPYSEKPLHEVGVHLFQSLFTGEVRDAYRASLAAAQVSGQHLRVVLKLAAPEVAALPWEMLFDPETGSYLCQDVPLLRHIPAADYSPRPLEVKPPLRILGIVAAPTNLPELDADTEKRYLARALERPTADGLVELAWAPQATWEGIQTTLLEGPWHVLHFIGHGDYDTIRQEGTIALESDTGRSEMVEAWRLMQLLKEAEPTPQLVVLNSCSSGAQGGEDLFSGTASALVRGGISAVAAMQFTVSDRAAAAFARGFYGAIAHGNDVDKAVGSGRRSILGLHTLEWVTPVLYVRGGSTHLFTFTGRPVPPEPQTPPLVPLDTEEPASPLTEKRQGAMLRALYLQARAELRTKNYGQAIDLLDELLAAAPGYRDAADLRKTAQNHRELSETYRAARQAEATGDWEAAIRGYALVQGDPDFMDAADRRAACVTRQRLADLQDELRLHADTGAWQAVLDAAAELADLDPSAADPDGLATRARLETLYTRARHAEDAGNPDSARQGYAEILTTDPHFRDAAARHNTCNSIARRPNEQGQVGHTTQAKPAASREVRRVSLQGSVWAVTFSPDGTRLATATDKDAQIWDVATGDSLLRVKHSWLLTQVSSVAFNPDGTRLATGGFDNSARIWDVASGDRFVKVRHDDTVLEVAFSPDGSRLATASQDKTAQVWDASSGLKQVRMSHRAIVIAVAFSPDGSRLATASGDNTARIWDSTTGKELIQVHHDGPLSGAALSPDGNRLATASGDNTARIWDSTTGKELIQVHHDGPVYSVAFSPDGGHLATASRDRTARIWRM